jgi:3',5'-cyclic AMP phosphodiesterase CpdA
MLAPMRARSCLACACVLLAISSFSAACSGAGGAGSLSGPIDDEADAGSAPSTLDDAGPGHAMHPLPSDDDAGADASLPAPSTTVDTRLLPTHALEAATGKNPAYADVRSMDLMQGYGAYSWGEGYPYYPRTLDDGPVPKWGAHPKRLARFAHLADLQLADDESTTRVAATDSSGATSGALRPQDAYLCHLTRAAVRAINKQHAYDPLAFTLLGGDNIDNAQPNELDWLTGILNGGQEVECDSGNDDDLIPGSENDPKDPFVPEGLHMPWLWVSGNHDELVQGNLAVSSFLQSRGEGEICVGGSRDYSEPTEVCSPLSSCVADARRRPMTSGELMQRLADTGNGHGIGAEQVTRQKAFYHYDLSDAPIRFVVMDTASETGGASGMLRQADVDAFVIPAIEEARELGRFVVLTSHHPIDSLTADGGPFGTAQDGALLPADFRARLGSYDHVLFSLVGHAHTLDVRPIVTQGAHAYWQVMTPAVADFPHELRMIELWDGDNGFYMMRATAVDVDTEDDALAEQGRVFGIIDYTTGWSAVAPLPGPEMTNVELWIRKPESLQ